MDIKDIYYKYNDLDFVIKIEIRRKNKDGSYETNWSDVRDLVNIPIVLEDSVPSLSTKTSNDNYAYGAVTVPNYKLSLPSENGEFASENDSNSIFYGYERHESLVRVSAGYKNPKDNSEILEELYVGFINENSSNTKVDKDNVKQLFQIEELLTYLLKKYTYDDVTPSANVLSDLVYQVMNRVEFKNFMNIDRNNIRPGFDIKNIRYVDDEGSPIFDPSIKILDLFTQLSLGHSFFYYRNGNFYYSNVEDNSNNFAEFNNNRIVELNNYRSGIDKVFEKIYWADTNLSYIPNEIKYNTPLEVSINAVGNETDRNSILRFIGIRSGRAKKECQLTVPFYPSLFLFDVIRARTSLTTFEKTKSLIWGLGKWGQKKWGRGRGAVIINGSELWSIRGIKHNTKSCKTTFTLKEIT